MFIDTHAHLHFRAARDAAVGGFETSFPDIEEVLDRAQQVGIARVINIGVNPIDSRAAMKLAGDKSIIQLIKDGKSPQLYATAGLHPHEAALGDQALDLIHDMAEDVVAIGECGLDYFKNHASQAEQEHAMRGQIEIAIEHSLPLIFHVRDAWDDFFTTLSNYPQIRGVIHSFTGHPEQVAQALDHPGELYFGLNGILTFTKDARQLEAAQAMPAERILLETDCPFLTPAPHRGQRNEPSFVPLIAESIATLRGIAIDELAGLTSANALYLFDLDVA